MPVDISNNIRVDLQEIYNSCEKNTAYYSRNHNNDEDHQRVIICKDDYDLVLHPWVMEAASIIADNCNYITATNQTGLEAISNPYVGGINPHDEKEIIDLMIDQKQTGEYLSKEVMDTLQFNVEQMSQVTPLKYTVTQTYIRGAIVSYILMKWYELNNIDDQRDKEEDNWERWLNKLLTNTFNMQKTIKTKKPYRLF